MSKFVAPSYTLPAFNCPICQAYASQKWHYVGLSRHSYPASSNSTGVIEEMRTGGSWSEALLMDGVRASECAHCRRVSIWKNGQLVIPLVTAVQPCHEDAPDDVRALYEEAASICRASARGAAALLRVALELLTHHLGASPRDKLNDKIGTLVSSGLPEGVIQSFDILRVVGNEAAHDPQTVLLDDNDEVAISLFELLNFSIEQTISRQKKLQKLHDTLPEGIRKGIERRNSKATGSSD